ncbi:hypothetical protein [Nocardia sp. CC227C]|uniref:hypothetical protein n=1 Tax=Nocardia sp. CC227C TaxID=3044562 RepID=UPI00278C509D|nr:hypothetical protein [Nocardia sp. CC227C]
MTNAHDSSRPPADPFTINIHLLNAALGAVSELTAELLETAEQHRTVAPHRAAQMMVLANVLMEQTDIWLRQVTRA